MALTKSENALNTKDGMQDLLAARDSSCVSIYLRTGCTPDTSQEAVARLKSQLASAEKQLNSAGESKLDLGPLRRLTTENDGWTYQGQSAALFLTEDFVATYSLPYACEDRALVDERFYIVPILPLVETDGVFYILMLSQENTRLLRSVRYGMWEVDLGDVPTSLKRDVRDDVFEESIQVHTTGAPTTGGQQRATMFHGHGGAGDKANVKRKLHHMFEHIDNAVSDIIGPENAPLVLVGLDQMQGLYRDLNHYQHLLEKGVSHNPEEMTQNDVHDQAWELVKPLFEQGLEKQKEQYAVLSGNESSRADSDIAGVVPSAMNKRIDILFVQLGAQQWGRWDASDQSVDLTERDAQGATELLNLSSVNTFQNGGKVYALSEEQMPDDDVVAAIYRF